MTYLAVHWRALQPWPWGCWPNLAVHWRALQPWPWGWWLTWLSIDERCNPHPDVDAIPGCPLTSSAAQRLMNYLTVHWRALQPWPWGWWPNLAVHWRALQPWPWGWWLTWLSIDERCNPHPDVDAIPGCPLTSSAALRLMNYLAVHWRALQPWPWGWWPNLAVHGRALQP